MICLVTAYSYNSYFGDWTTASMIRDAFTELGIPLRNCGFYGFFSLWPVSLVGLITRQEFERECSVELGSTASSFQKSAPENCATESTRRKLEIFPRDRSHNVSFSGRSFHRFPVPAIKTRSIMTRRDGPLSFDVRDRPRRISLHYRALLLRKSIACKEKDG